MNDLTTILVNNTQELKRQYLEKTKEWAVRDHQSAIEKSKWTNEKWCEVLGLEPRIEYLGTPREIKTFPRGFFNTRESRTYNSQKSALAAITKYSLEKYLERQEKIAIEHYNHSIDKLVFRLGEKGVLVDENLKVQDTKLEHCNLSLTITFKNQFTGKIEQLRAWTIIASGEIQRPHYRYLIK